MAGCAPGYLKRDGQTGGPPCAEADTCEPMSCTNPVTDVDGYVLPTCTAFTTGSIVCDPLPTCADGYFGTPAIDDVTCDADGDELSVSGCTACDAVANGLGLTCTAAGESEVTGCEAGYTHEPNACGSDRCVAKTCSSPTTGVDGYVLPVCSGVSTGSIACDPCLLYTSPSPRDRG